ncbi:MAG: protein kinase [Polyangiaceae bacterium]|nr:protein kinase [Polyangiaceae bacterium]
MTKDPMLEDEATIDIGGVLPEMGVSAGGPVILAGRYLLLGLLGTGGMGTVYRARDLDLSEEIAVKVLRRELVESPSIVARFKQEVRLARRVTHRNVARTFDTGEHGGERFITMEYIDGEALADKLAKRGKLPLGEALDMAGSICAGLAAAHTAGIVHRDLKPENVLVEPNGRVVLTDFGMALTFEDAEGDTVVDGSNELVGTPVYMAPEQVEGRVDIDARADVYALGAMLYEMVTGERPWRGESAWAVASARLLSPPPDPRAVVPELPESVSRVITRAMSKNREDRYRDIEDMANEISTITLPSGPVSLRGHRASMASIPDLPVEIGTKAVAVLPFAFASEEDELYSEGIMLDLIDTLAGVEGLRVRGPRASSEHAPEGRDVRAVGQKLGVQAVIDGSLRRAGGRVQVVARLTAVVDGFQLWASRIERAEDDWFSLVADISRGVTGALTVRERTNSIRELVDADGLIDYLDARNRLLHAENADDLEPVLALGQSDDARLIALAAEAAWRRARHGAAERAAVMRDRAADAACRAVAVAPELATPRVVLSRIALAQGTLVEGARALRESLRLAPGAPEIQALFGRVLALVGRPRQGLTFLDAALTLEPSLEEAFCDALRVRALLAEWGAIERAVSSGARSPDRDEMLARLALWHPDPGLAHAVARIPGLSPRAAALASAKRGPDGSRQALVALRAIQPHTIEERIERLQLEAELLAGAGDEAAALAAIESASTLGLTDVTWLERCPLLAPLGGQLASIAADVARRAENVRLMLRTSRRAGEP